MADLLLPEKLEDSHRKMFQNYGLVNTATQDFAKKVKITHLQFLFGEEEGVRLWNHFVRECDRRYDKFVTYLTAPQYNILLVNITLNENLYAT